MYDFRKQATMRGLTKVKPCAGANGNIGATDIGRLVVESSGGYGYLYNTSEATTNIKGRIGGIIAAVPDATTAGSTTPFYIRQVLPGDELETDCSTAGTTALVSSNLNYYLGPLFSSTPSAAGGASLDCSTGSTGVTEGRFFRVTGYSTTRNKVYGTIATTHLV